MSSVGFKFGEDSGKTPRTIQGIVPAESYLVGYTDNDGKSKARIAFRIAGSETTYILQERLGGHQVVLPANAWFHKAFVDQLQAKGHEEATEPVESL